MTQNLERAEGVEITSQRVCFALARNIKDCTNLCGQKKTMVYKYSGIRSPVEKKVLAMHLVSRQVKAPDVPIILNENVHRRITGRAGICCKEVPHLALILSATRLRELNLRQKLITLRGRAVFKPYAKRSRRFSPPSTADETNSTA